jgi:hypothetical protein
MAKKAYIKGIFPRGKCLFSCFFNENEKKVGKSLVESNICSTFATAYEK